MSAPPSLIHIFLSCRPKWRHLKLANYETEDLSTSLSAYSGVEKKNSALLFSFLTGVYLA